MSNESPLFKKGLEIRRAVAGDEYVDKALSNANDDFARPMQELVTEYCWGSIWSRPGLERKQRSLLNIAMLTALNRSPELAAHVRGAINNGCSAVEIRETILQAAIYCGVPAGIEATKTAQKVVFESSSNCILASCDVFHVGSRSFPKIPSHHEISPPMTEITTPSSRPSGLYAGRQDHWVEASTLEPCHDADRADGDS